MTAREALEVQLAAYDDDAWSALANRGLLRRARKDLELTTPSLIDETADLVRVQVGPHIVGLDARGPAHATCSCPSSGPCQHLLAAGLWLASMSAQTTAATTHADSPTPTAMTAGDQFHDELMAVDAAAIVAHAGRAGHRWAHQFSADLDVESDVRVSRGRNTAVTFQSPRVTFRYMGGGLAGLVPDVRLPALEKYQVAAVLAYQRLHGSNPVPPEPVATLSRDRDEPLEPSRARLRTATSRLLTDTIGLGVSHVSPSVHERFATLAVWAQGASYFRLALLLRRIADHVELLLARSAQADELRLLDEATTAYALVRALDEAARSGRAPAHLVGQSRTRYDAVRRLDVIGLGSVPWHAQSGFRGLTTLFWWPDERRFLSLTDARPDTLGAWDPRTRHTAAGPWQGLTSPAAAAGARLILGDAQLSSAGRLSGVERTQALVTPLDGAELVSVLPVAADFGALEGPVADRARLLATPDPLRDWVVLAPEAFGRSVFDPVAQVLHWPVADAFGRTVLLTVAYTSIASPTVERVEQVAADEPAPGTLVVCRLRMTPRGLTGEPLSLVHPSRSKLKDPVEELHFGSVTDQRDRPQRRRPAGDAPPREARVDLPRELTDLTAWHRRQAERGTAAVSAAALARELNALHERLRAVGFDVFPAVTVDPANRTDVADALLASHFVARQVEVLLTGHNAD